MQFLRECMPLMSLMLKANWAAERKRKKCRHCHTVCVQQKEEYEKKNMKCLCFYSRPSGIFISNNATNWLQLFFIHIFGVSHVGRASHSIYTVCCNRTHCSHDTKSYKSIYYLVCMCVVIIFFNIVSTHNLFYLMLYCHFARLPLISFSRKNNHVQWTLHAKVNLSLKTNKKKRLAVKNWLAVLRRKVSEFEW